MLIFFLIISDVSNSIALCAFYYLMWTQCVSVLYVAQVLPQKHKITSKAVVQFVCFSATERQKMESLKGY